MVDGAEFTELVKKYRRALFLYCYYKLNCNINLTEDTVNDIFKTLYQKWETLIIDDNIRAYLYKVADVYIKEHRRKDKHYYDHNKPIDDLYISEKIKELVIYDDYFSDKNIDETEYIDKVKEKLPDKYKELFTYRYIEKKTLMEIAYITKTPYSTVRLRLMKIERIIREEVKKLFN